MLPLSVWGLGWCKLHILTNLLLALLPCSVVYTWNKLPKATIFRHFLIWEVLKLHGIDDDVDHQSVGALSAAAISAALVEQRQITATFHSTQDWYLRLKTKSAMHENDELGWQNLGHAFDQYRDLEWPDCKTAKYDREQNYIHPHRPENNKTVEITIVTATAVTRCHKYKWWKSVASIVFRNGNEKATSSALSSSTKLTAPL